MRIINKTASSFPVTLRTPDGGVEGRLLMATYLVRRGPRSTWHKVVGSLEVSDDCLSEDLLVLQKNGTIDIEEGS